MIAIGIGWLVWGILAKKPLRIVIGLVIAMTGVVLVPLIQDQFDSAPVAAAKGVLSPVPAPAAAQPSAPLLPATPMPYAATTQTVYGTTIQRPLAAPPTTSSAGTTGPAGPSDSLDLSNSGLSGTTAPTAHPAPAVQGAR